MVGQCPEMGKEDCEVACKAAAEAFVQFKTTTGRQRAKMLRDLNDALLEHKADLAHVLVKEVGKTKAEAEGEVVYAASFLDWFASEAERTVSPLCLIFASDFLQIVWRCDSFSKSNVTYSHNQTAHWSSCCSLPLECMLCLRVRGGF